MGEGGSVHIVHFWLYYRGLRACCIGEREKKELSLSKAFCFGLVGGVLHLASLPPGVFDRR